eukprot:m.31706 g.31706  ORF g.31706 m.31706 type:complete len:109 (+) comp10708_c0_seq4:1072-1398(+)
MGGATCISPIFLRHRCINFRNAPMPNATLAVSLETCPRLVQWCRQLEQLHFGREHREYRRELKSKAEDDKRASSQRLRVAVTVAAVISLMAGYSFFMRKIPQNVVLAI